MPRSQAHSSPHPRRSSIMSRQCCPNWGCIRGRRPSRLPLTWSCFLTEGNRQPKRGLLPFFSPFSHFKQWCCSAYACKVYYVLFVETLYDTLDEAIIKEPDAIAAHRTHSNELHDRGTLLMAGA